MPQRFETAVAHIAIYQLGAVAMPLSMLFGPDALEYRLNDSEAKVAIVDESAIVNLRAARPACPALATVITVGAAVGQGDVDWLAVLRREPPLFEAAPHTRRRCGGADLHQRHDRPAQGRADPAPRADRQPAGLRLQPELVPGHRQCGVLVARRLGVDRRLDGRACCLPLYFGRPIVGYAGRFDPLRAFALMQRHRVTHTFLFPTALKAMMKAVPAPRAHYALELRAIMSAGEAVGDAVFAYCRDALGVTVNEMFGQTEVNYIVGNCGVFIDTQGARHTAWPARPGSMGRPYPGHRVAVLDDDDKECPRGVAGDVAVHRRDVHGDADPIFFLGYWKNDAATRAKFTGDPDDSWCRTGDMAVMDADGYLWYQGRSDDMFKAAGYRIGPGEIENCLVKHPAVANAAVVPKPDAERGAVVKAYVVLAAGFDASDALVQELQQHVRGKLAPYEYPKEIEFIAALPMTTTGKVQRRVLRLQEAARAEQPAGMPSDD